MKKILFTVMAICLLLNGCSQPKLVAGIDNLLATEEEIEAQIKNIREVWILQKGRTCLGTSFRMMLALHGFDVSQGEIIAYMTKKTGDDYSFYGYDSRHYINAESLVDFAKEELGLEVVLLRRQVWSFELEYLFLEGVGPVVMGAKFDRLPGVSVFPSSRGRYRHAMVVWATSENKVWVTDPGGVIGPVYDKEEFFGATTLLMYVKR